MHAVCVTRHEGYWSYEFCYKKGLRQFHTVAMRDSKGLCDELAVIFARKEPAISYMVLYMYVPLALCRTDVLQGGQ
jgi:hypothetical protein